MSPGQGGGFYLPGFSGEVFAAGEALSVLVWDDTERDGIREVVITGGHND